MNKLFYFFLLFSAGFLWTGKLIAQEAEGHFGLMTLHDAIDSALERNFDIRISQISLEQAKINNTAGNAGMLPDIYATGGMEGAWDNSRIKFATGQSQDATHASSIAVTGSVVLDWVLFDGMRMFINKKRLDEIQRSGAIELRKAIQNTVVAVINTYAQVVRQKQQLIALDTALSLARVRMEIAGKKFEIGSSDKTDFLQAKVDLNASKAAYLMQEAALRSAKDSLMVLIGARRFAAFTVQDSLFLNKNLVFKDREAWLSDNFSMQLARQEKRISNYDYRMAKAAQWPTIRLGGAYDYNRINSSSGYALYNRNYGPAAGLTISIPIFDGLKIQTAKKIARQELFRRDLMIYKLTQVLDAQYRSAWRAYQNALKALELEQENIQYARENVTIQQARFKVGLSNTLQLRAAESSYVAGLSRLVDAAYTVKVTATRLLALENQLVR